MSTERLGRTPGRMTEAYAIWCGSCEKRILVDDESGMARPWYAARKALDAGWNFGAGDVWCCPECAKEQP